MCIADAFHLIFIVDYQLNILKQPKILRSSQGTSI